LYLALLIDEDFQTTDTGSLCGSASTALSITSFGA
jgi:hypothetical protein